MHHSFPSLCVIHFARPPFSIHLPFYEAPFSIHLPFCKGTFSICLLFCKAPFSTHIPYYTAPFSLCLPFHEAVFSVNLLFYKVPFSLHLPFCRVNSSVNQLYIPYLHCYGWLLIYLNSNIIYIYTHTLNIYFFSVYQKLINSFHCR